MIDRLIQTVVIIAIALALIYFIVPLLGAFAAIAKILVALVTLLVVIGIIADYRPWRI